MFKVLAAIAALTVAAPAVAQVTIDGSYDAAYGAAKSTVTFNPPAASFDFGAPTQYSERAGYSIYLTSDANNVYGYMRADRDGGLPFANIYFDIDPANGNGSDLGFEVFNDRAFVPGMAGYSSPLGLSFARSADNLGLEFALSNSLFTGPIAGLTYYAGQEFPGLGDDVVLRLSQSFNYSVAGGASYGSDRLGRVTIGGAAVGAVPEPATWAMMILGFGLIGSALRRHTRRQALTFA